MYQAMRKRATGANNGPSVIPTGAERSEAERRDLFC
jgi:hypothetical protein